MKRTCPVCGMINFSAAAQEDYWICCRCKTLIGKESQEPVTNEDGKDD
jgi:ribosomal protein S27AE